MKGKAEAKGKTVARRFDCLVEREGSSITGLWYGWLSPLDSSGGITDEFITARFSRKHGAVCRLREIANRMGMGEGAQEAITLASEECGV